MTFNILKELFITVMPIICAFILFMIWMHKAVTKND